jgi:hypothetical protein
MESHEATESSFSQATTIDKEYSNILHSFLLLDFDLL